MSVKSKKISLDKVRKGISRSFEQLTKEDGYLFERSNKHNSNYYVRKLHEVCINHRLANNLEKYFVQEITVDESLFVDIEFNREGDDFKEAPIDDQKQRVRPDIIIHNRKAGNKKSNILIIECKKHGATKTAIKKDRSKIIELMENKKYEYLFGLQVIYQQNGVSGTLFIKSDSVIKTEEINYNKYEA